MKLYELEQLEINWAFIGFSDFKIPIDKITSLEHSDCIIGRQGVNYCYNPFDVIYTTLPFCLTTRFVNSEGDLTTQIFSYTTQENLDSDFKKLHSFLKKYDFKKYKNRLKRKGYKQ
jgi:hypothetical protein